MVQKEYTRLHHPIPTLMSEISNHQNVWQNIYSILIRTTPLIWIIFNGRKTIVLNPDIGHLLQCFVISVNIFTLSANQNYCPATVTGSLNRVNAKTPTRTVYYKLYQQVHLQYQALNSLSACRTVCTKLSHFTPACKLTKLQILHLVKGSYC